MGLFLGPYGGPRDLNPGPYSKKSLRGGANMAAALTRLLNWSAIELFGTHEDSHIQNLEKHGVCCFEVDVYKPLIVPSSLGKCGFRR